MPMSTPEIKIPARIQALAEKAGGNPIAWNGKADGSIVIVFEDGRKLTFEPMSSPKLDALSTSSSIFALENGGGVRRTEGVGDELEPITPKKKVKP